MTDKIIGLVFIGLAGVIVYNLARGLDIIRLGMEITGQNAPIVFLIWVGIAAFACALGVYTIVASRDDR